MSKKVLHRAALRLKEDASSSLTLIVEGRTDALILRQLLTGYLPARFRFFASQGRMSMTSLARNVLVHEPDPVVIILDADKAAASRVESEQASALEALYSSARYGVFAFSPSLDKVIEEATGRELSGSNIRPEELENLQAHPQIQRLLDVVAGLVQSRPNRDNLTISQ